MHEVWGGLEQPWKTEETRGMAEPRDMRPGDLVTAVAVRPGATKTERMYKKHWGSNGQIPGFERTR